VEVRSGSDVQIDRPNGFRRYSKLPVVTTHASTKTDDAEPDDPKLTSPPEEEAETSLVTTLKPSDADEEKKKEKAKPKGKEKGKAKQGEKTKTKKEDAKEPEEEATDSATPAQAKGFHSVKVAGQSAIRVRGKGSNQKDKRQQDKPESEELRRRH